MIDLWPQLHLAVTHLPIVVSLVATVFLAFALRGGPATRRAAYWLVATAGVLAVLTYLSGSAAEDAVEKLPGFSEQLVERHGDLAKLALGLAVVDAVVVAALATVERRFAAARAAIVLVLAINILANGAFVVTAHQGGLIRHPELGGPSAVSAR